MRHSVDHLTAFLDEKLQEIRDKNDGTLRSVNDAFVYAFGPFMSMEPGFEKDCDEIARYSDAMKIIQFVAFLIRRITIGVSYGSSKKIIRDFIVQVDTEFPKDRYTTTNQCLIDFAVNYLENLRSEQGTNLESFITQSAPIVPYQPVMLAKQPLEPGLETRIDCVDAVQAVITQANQNVTNRNTALMTILQNNLAGVLKWKDLTTVIEDPETGANNLMELDHLIIDNREVPHGVRAYYFLATINYYGLPIEIFDKYLNFFRVAGDFSKPQSYESFEAMIDEMAETVNPNISMESWQIDLEAEGYDEKSIQRLIGDIPMDSGKPISEKDPTFDVNKVLNYIALHREIQVGEWPNRAFSQDFSKGNIVSVNHFDNNVTMYEVQMEGMNVPLLICPYVNVIDWKPRVLVLYGKTNDLENMLLTDFLNS